MSPLYFLGLVALLTAAARLLEAGHRRRRRTAIEPLARSSHLHYSATDRFGLALKVTPLFPIPGAAEVRVLDLLYGREGEHYRYVFSAEYTVGVTRGKHRYRRVVTLRERRDRANGLPGTPAIELAPENLTLAEQYKWLLDRVSADTDPAPPAG
jgi:hypothetical protein